MINKAPKNIFTILSLFIAFIGLIYTHRVDQRTRYDENVNTDLKLSEITGLNAVLHVVPCNLSYDMICQKF